MITNVSLQDHFIADNHMQVQFHSTTEHRPADEQQHQTLDNITVDRQLFRN